MKILIAIFLVWLGINPVLWAQDYAAVLQWYKRVELGLPISGVVAQVKANVGDRVKAGQILLALDQKSVKAQVAQAQAQVTSAQRRLQEAQAEWDRAKELYERTVLSNSERDEVESKRIQAESELRIAQAQLSQAQTQLKFSTIKAPFEGLVVKRAVEPGQTIVSALQAAPLMILVDANTMVARILVSPQDITRFQIGQAATVKIDNKNFSAKIHQVGFEPVMSNGDAHYEVDVLFNTENQVLRAGQKATVVP